uniref:Uncharacterized protein n=1 Tax=Apteryx owenii TaxID=8824 RepID=A0A8B9SAL5_APTOW
MQLLRVEQGLSVLVFSIILPWLHFSLLYVQRLGSLLPVKNPILSSILVLQENSLSLYQALLWREGDKKLKITVLSLETASCLPLCPATPYPSYTAPAPPCSEQAHDGHPPTLQRGTRSPKGPPHRAQCSQAAFGSA